MKRAIHDPYSLADLLALVRRDEAQYQNYADYADDAHMAPWENLLVWATIGGASAALTCTVARALVRLAEAVCGQPGRG